ncbi:MAG: type II secretion system minor pseudopilin GspI, partial [Gammaproteobacteria bacterium]|nr:type II secretion system minor pseudopilin GspI [Gammaproteobacteria bacterium]
MNHNPGFQPRAAGFTLIEVLVAMAIVGLSFIAMFSGIRQVVDGAVTMQDRTLASWVAYDQLTELRLSGEFPTAGSRRNGEIDMADTTWRYSVVFNEGGESPIIRQAIVRVAREDEPDIVLAEVTGVLLNQAAAGGAGGNWGDSGRFLLASPDPNALPGTPSPQPDGADSPDSA